MTNILDLFSKEELAKFTKDSSDNLRGPCPCCGMVSGGQSNSSGCVVFPKTNTLHCFGSSTNFDFLETIALVKGIISCSEGRQSK